MPKQEEQLPKNTLIPALRFPEFQDAGEWEEKTLGEVTLQISERNKEGRKLPIYSISNVAGFLPQSDQFDGIDSHDRGYDISLYKIIKRNTFAYNPARINVGSIGYSGELHNIIISSLYVCFVTKEEVDDLFLFHYFKTPDFNESVKRNVEGGIRSYLFYENFARIKFSFPSLPEQRKIADCLSSLDEWITAEGEKLEALKAHKKGLMQQLFPAQGETVPRLRFPEFQDSEEWEEISLIDVTDKKIKWSFIGGPFGSNLKSSDYTAKGIRVIQLQNIGDGEFLNDYKIFTSEEKANELLSCNIYPGDIIMSKMGDPVGRACLIPDTYSRYLMCSDGIRLVVDNKKFDQYFIFSLINSAHFRASIEKEASGSTRKRISLDDLKNLSMIVPVDLPEQQKIADCLSSLDELITAQGEQVALLKRHKKGLMQRLFP